MLEVSRKKRKETTIITKKSQQQHYKIVTVFSIFTHEKREKVNPGQPNDHVIVFHICYSVTLSRCMLLLLLLLMLLQEIVSSCVKNAIHTHIYAFEGYTQL